MKNRYIIISAVVIALIGTFIVYKVTIGKQAEQVDEQVDVQVASNISIDTNESLEESTPAPTPDPLPESSIDYKDIDPEIHATYNESTGEIIVDETMSRTMLMDSPLFEKRAITDKYVKCVLEVYLDGYYTGRFDGDAWYRFAATGDTTYLNFELSDEELASKIEQKHESLLTAEAEQVAAAEPTEEPSSLFETTNETPENKDYLEDAYAQTAEKYGLTVDELKAILGVTTDTSKGNTGGGSSQIATPSTDQSSANENNFVTPETNNGANNNSGSDARPGETTRIPMDGGDGGPLTGNVQLNP